MECGENRRFGIFLPFLLAARVGFMTATKNEEKYESGDSRRTPNRVPSATSKRASEGMFDPRLRVGLVWVQRGLAHFLLPAMLQSPFVCSAAVTETLAMTYDLKTCTLRGGTSALCVCRTVTLVRERKGKVYLAVSRRWLGIPLGTTTCELAAYDSLLVTGLMDPGRETSDGETPNSLKVDLRGPGVRRLRVYRGDSEADMHELIDTLRSWGLLKIIPR